MNRILPPRRLAVAPMLDWTDRHYRSFLRLITKHTWLYTEMVTTGAILHGDKSRHLDFEPAESPIALQLGGSEPADLARCARIAEDWGYDEINLNVGCPSERVQSGAFGACLMAEPVLIADCVKAMQGKVDIPVTVKHRIGINDVEDYAYLRDFVGQVHDQSGCRVFIVHARNAILKGLSPKENREIPPLKYHYVYQLKQDFPELEILINGGITRWDEVDTHLAAGVDGVMIGREAYHNPYLFAEADSRYYQDNHTVPSRRQVIEALIPYLNRSMARGSQVKHIARHILGLYQGMPGARQWRRMLSDAKLLKEATPDLLLQALEAVEQETHRLHARPRLGEKDSHAETGTGQQ